MSLNRKKRNGNENEYSIAVKQRKPTNSQRNSNTALTDNFEKLVQQSDVFADKTLFIADFLTATSTTYVITRPRGWAKSLNLNMLYFFLHNDGIFL